MNRKIYLLVLVFFLPLLGSGCGGGSSGTAIGNPGNGKSLKFTGIVLNPNGDELGFTKVTLINTDEDIITDEAGVFELNSEFPGGDATFEVQPNNEPSAAVTLTDVPPNSQDNEISIVFDQTTDSASLQAITLRARIVRNCSPAFLNTRTIKQSSALADGTNCTIEVQIKSDGLPVNQLVFHLQRRGCSADDPWRFISAASTGTSGLGNGEIDFKFRNDEAHCIYRVQGPLGISGITPVTAQIFTLRKQQSDSRGGK